MQLHHRLAALLVAAIAWPVGAPAGAASQPPAPEGRSSALAPRCPGRAVLVMKSGELLPTARGFEVEGSRVRYQNESGTLLAVRLAEIDEPATAAAERTRCPADPGTTATGDGRAVAPVRRDPVEQLIDALVELGVVRARLEAMATDPELLRAAVDAVVSVATELERRTREIELAYRLDTVGGMIAAAPAYREVAAFAREAAARESDPRIGAVIGDLAAAFDEVARLAAEEPERAIEEFDRQRPR